MNRDRRFDRPDEWRRTIAARICAGLEDYEDADHVPISIIESATVAAVHGATAPLFVTRLILPSHLLKIAREHYGSRKWALCLKFCNDALTMGDRLTEEGRIEACRLKGLSAVRVSDDAEFERATDGLGRLKHLRSARRNTQFLKGFRCRLRGRLDDAEAHFLKAWDAGRDNQSTNREIASLYCRQGRYNEAETYARVALKRDQTNPTSSTS